MCQGNTKGILKYRGIYVDVDIKRYIRIYIYAYIEGYMYIVRERELRFTYLSKQSVGEIYIYRDSEIYV